MNTSIESLVRPNILALKPYTSARDEFQSAPSAAVSPSEMVFLDANENSLGGPLEEDYSRYPDPHQKRLKAIIGAQRNLLSGQIFLGNGSDEAIDLLIRVFCEPGRDAVLLLPPTYGMYAVQAAIQNARIERIPLKPDFNPDIPAIRKAGKDCKLLFLCSPNNPTGNRFATEDVREILSFFPGIVVVDEAYIDFSATPSLTGLIDEFPNLVVLQTFSKGWGLAGLRVGMAFSNAFIIQMLDKIKYPYNLDVVTMRLLETALQCGSVVQEKIDTLLEERNRLAAGLNKIPCVKQVFPSDANFLLVRVSDADAIYARLCAQGMVVRNRSKEIHCENCLRITIGAPDENDRLLDLMKDL
ncbi:MAG: histidinol-phosphate transaminase [Bacteroidota bacterium]